jgi:hypothetical protein
MEDKVEQKEFKWVRPKVVTYKILTGPDRHFIAFRVEGKQEVALSKEKTIEALALHLFTPGQTTEVITGEKRGFEKVSQEDLLALKLKLKNLLVNA